mmetsp:Transcript_37707/g.83012  ORF Transcript_37707/g.83012 Transcript_37707/m.83012 type:complete len:530 (-) Transcript_37707:26-1615(-)
MTLAFLTPGPRGSSKRENDDMCGLLRPAACGALEGTGSTALVSCFEQAQRDTAAISKLAWHAAWFAAESRCLNSGWRAEKHRAAWVAVQRELSSFLGATTARAIGQLTLSASWHAANTRRLVLTHASRDAAAMDAATAAVAAASDADVALAVRRVATHAAWHAANVRTWLWRDAARDFSAYEQASVSLAFHLEQWLLTLMPAHNEDSRAETASHATHASLASLICSSVCFEVRRMLPFRKLWSAPAAPLRVEDFKRADVQRGSCTAATLSSVSESSLSVSSGSVAADEGIVNGASSEAKGVNPESSASDLAAEDCLLDGVTQSWRLVELEAQALGALHPSPLQTPTAPFLVAAFETVAILETLGGAVAPFCADIRRSVDKLRQAAAALSVVTMEQMVDVDLQRGDADADAGTAQEGSSTLALIWLGRSLRMIAEMIRQLSINPKISFRECILRGYNTALRRHHSKLAQRLIGAGIWGAPSRKHFISLLSADAAHVEAMLAQLRLCFVPVVKRLHAFLVLRNLETRDAFD